MSEKLTPAEVACLLRAARRQRDALSQERDRLVTEDNYLTHKEHSRILEIEAELVCMESAIRWLWRPDRH